MAEQPKNPHDAYFRHVMSEATAAAGEMRTVLPEAAAAHLDWDGLELQSCSFVPQELRSRYTDVLFWTRWDDRDAFVFMLIEHQSSADELMAFRMLEYMIDRLGPRAKEIMMTTAEQFRTEGRTEGRAEALLEQLVVKFGAVPDRVVGIVRGGGEAARLRVWGARVLTADSLDEVFAE
ncbi:Rpn family recombination-promoting nuclease/putative transposase [Nocardia huaxiensis]|uniref:Rpn family recombination-promoting nuclease/putative transposase n=1 Tax=Nocardia huaxiensis TaxID=2755382 RepID=A0A7D6VCS7_9NOCA|nr:Rpn family recombination-promoting nuclease/putative transposase [Nocardia huaxiensis]QLY29235.1 Rpn family recombination-promoting nuclease/putative transposase [Nocardia huaxiensis]